MKKIISIVLIAVLLLAVTVGGIFLYKTNSSNLYKTNVSKSYITEAAKLDLDNFNVVDSYCKRDNKNFQTNLNFIMNFLLQN